MGQKSNLKKLHEEVERFDLHWDKNAQLVMNQLKYNEACRNVIPRLEDYFEFLSDIEPSKNIPSPQKTVIVDKQFTLK
jgi:hypothetical protein